MQDALNWVFKSLYETVFGWLGALDRLLRECAHRKNSRRERWESDQRYVRCQVIPPDVYKRPDPLIYCQQYLMSLGLAVTWDNPDIQLYEVGPPLKAVSSSELKAGTEYEIHATIHNGSTDAPAIGLPVEFSYLSFGIGTVSNWIGATSVDLHVKGSPQEPVVARMLWRTPDAAGHYCIQVKLVWADDSNPNNNLGQENTNVGQAHSPALFDFDTHNGTRRSRDVTLIADMYQIPDPVDCNELAGREKPYRRGHEPQKTDQMTPEELDAARRSWCVEMAREHDPEKFPIAPGWKVEIEPNQFTQAPDETTTIKASITPPDGWTGTQAVNVNGRDTATGAPLGGVTLYVKRS
jgi:hypothetical protein